MRKIAMSFENANNHNVTASEISRKAALDNHELKSHESSKKLEK
jgi:hypothetical protein